MHLNNERLLASLTLKQQLNEEELHHLNTCPDCLTEHEKLRSLKISAEHYQLMTPPTQVWQGLKANLPKVNKRNTNAKTFATSLAASLFLTATCWLMWSNYTLQNQLEQVLIVPSAVEMQLVNNDILTFQQTQLLSRIHLLDLQLMKMTTLQNKLALLQQRKKLITQMRETNRRAKQQGKGYEYSI